jgi:hemoglobin/transferrin/lactoferrin receptor protein
MKMFWVWVIALMFSFYGRAQTDTLMGNAEVVISANKWEQKLNEVPNKIVKVTQRDIAFNNPQTAADMLLQTGAVFVQKSQLAGGSPIIRGFATNRVLLVVDGIRMNNAIYRSGNLQNVISIDPLAMQSAEVVFGPGSIIYGSDAIGGVMDFHSLPARLKTENEPGKILIKANALTRYSTANNEQTLHADVNLASRKLAWMGSITKSAYGNLKMGKKNGFDEYLRPEYVQRINNRDSIIQNSNPYKQVFSGFEQWNVVQKLRYKPTEGLDLQYSFHFGQTGTAPRYDRLIEYRNSTLRFARWDYGPMIWRMHTIQANLLKKNNLYDQARVTIGYQHYEESRIDRQRNNANQRTQAEKVNAWTANFDANKKIGKGDIFYGFEYVDNLVNSSAWSENINNANSTGVATRYPDGSTWKSLGVYAMYKWNFDPKWTLDAGLRYSQGIATATFSKEFVPYPFDEADINDGAFTPSLGIVYRPADYWQINGNISTGFRIPNIDDLGKLFESNPGNVVIPNPNLQSEYAWNYEVGTAYRKPEVLNFEANIFHTRLNNAIVRRPASFQGQDSILFDGVKSQVESLQNIGLLTVWGLQLMAEWWVAKSLSIYTMANFTNGKETDDSKDEQVPLRHAPPFFGQSGVKWNWRNLKVEIFTMYNSEISHANLAPSEQAKVFIYAKDSNGNTFSPGWHTLNLRAGYHFSKLDVNAAWENITNQMYRPYGSGIVAPGSNFIISLRVGI